MAERSICMSTLAATPGQRLALPVRRADGEVLLPAGTELEVDHLRNLIQRGIDCIYVAQEETRDAEQIERDIAAAAARVAHLFRGPGSAAREELAEAVADYRRRAAS